MSTFTLEPSVGPLPLRFGMTPSEVQALIGPPDRVTTTYFGNRAEHRRHVNLGFSADTEVIIEAVILPGSKLLLRGQDLYAIADPIAFLRRMDPDPQLRVGFLFFPALGIALSGFHDNDESQKAIQLMTREYMSQFLNEFAPHR